MARGSELPGVSQLLTSSLRALSPGGGPQRHDLRLCLRPRVTRVLPSLPGTCVVPSGQSSPARCHAQDGDKTQLWRLPAASSSFQQQGASGSRAPERPSHPPPANRLPSAVASWLPQPLPGPGQGPWWPRRCHRWQGPLGSCVYGASVPLLWLRAPARAFRGRAQSRLPGPWGGHTPSSLLGPQAWASSHRGPTLSPRHERFGFLVGKPSARPDEGKLSPPTGGCHMPLHPAHDPATPMAAGNRLHRRRD